MKVARYRYSLDRRDPDPIINYPNTGGEVVGFVSDSGKIKAIIQLGRRLKAIDIDNCLMEEHGSN